MGNIPEQLVNMLESLGGAIKTNVVVPATQKRVQKVGVKVVFETARVHLNRQLIHCHNSYCQRFFLIVYSLRGLAGLDDLRETF